MTKTNRNRFTLLGAITFLVLMIFILWKVPEWQLRDSGLEVKERVELENDTRATLAQIFGGLFLLTGLYFTWRRITATERNVEIAQEAQVTERFTRAINQLGHRKIEICLGGIYALERIARDAKTDEYHRQIMEIFAAYVRHHAPYDPITMELEAPKIKAEIQTILTVLGRSKRALEGSAERRLDLSKVNIWGAHLEEGNLKGVDFSGANLERVHLEKANLEGVIFTNARLVWTGLANANLKQADLRVVNLTHAKLNGANLEGADLSRAIGLTKEQIEAAIIDDNTTLPDYLRACLKTNS